MIEENGLACKCAEKPKELCRRLEQQRDAAVEALEHIEEYWNRNQNEKAMADALWHMLETAHATLAAIKESK